LQTDDGAVQPTGQPSYGGSRCCMLICVRMLWLSLPCQDLEVCTDQCDAWGCWYFHHVVPAKWQWMDG
jgi:hypothetical protein